MRAPIPHPNPGVEKHRHSVTYDRKAEGVDYAAGCEHVINANHTVPATDEELARWTR